MINFNDNVEFIAGIKVVKLTATTKKGFQYQLKQRVAVTYLSGGENLMAEDSFSVFEEEDKTADVYNSERYCLKTFPQKFDTVAKVQAFLDLPKNKSKVYIKEIYGFNPFSLNSGLEYGVNNGLTSIGKVMDNTLKLKGSKDNLTQMFATYKGKSCPVYSVKDLSIEVNGIKKDVYQELKVGYEPMMLDESDDDSNIFSNEINEAVEAEGEW